MSHHKPHTPAERVKRRFDFFLPGLAVAIALAWILPGPGAPDGWLHPKVLNKAGVALLFFLHGAALSVEAVKAGVMRWKLHMVVQSCTFLLFPLIGLAVYALLGGALGPDLRLGVFFLCALPSTVSSSVAMTSIARGNVAGAVFNATVSSVIGVFITPLWIAAVLNAGGQSLPVGKVILDLVLWLILPLVAGHLSRPLTAAFMHRHKHVLHYVDRGTILLLVYTAFCDSVVSGVWEGKGLDLLLLAVGFSAILFFVVMFLAGRLSDALGFPVEDRIAAIFCGSKKSIATGVPMGQIMFLGNPALSVILLPLIIYHAVQLIICARLARRWGERAG